MNSREASWPVCHSEPARADPPRPVIEDQVTVQTLIGADLYWNTPLSKVLRR
jgi:hypothetical protein